MEKKIMIMRAYIDVDGVCAALGRTWLAMYNSEYNDNLQEHQIKTWAIETYVKPECGYDIFKYLDDPHLYDHVIPVDGAKDGVMYLNNIGFEIIYVTSSPNGDGKPKYQWLCTHGFTTYHRVPEDFVVMSNKSLLDPTNAIMVDDNFRYIDEFGGFGILYTRPHNEDVDYRVRIDKWNDIRRIVRLDNWNETNKKIDTPRISRY
jgi:5'-nucleotidase